jgi:ferrous iron transport protein B
MTTILIAPLMSCSARLPVYYLMIGTFIPDHPLFGFWAPAPYIDVALSPSDTHFHAGIAPGFFGLTTRAATMFGLYVLGVAAAMLAAWVFKRTLFKGPQPALMLELPPYKVPAWRNVVTTMWDRGAQFLQRAGTVIFALSILLWFSLSYPRVDPSTLKPGMSQDQIAALETQHSAAGRLGHAIEPLIKPLGFNWKMGIGLIGSMAAREVFVSTMGTVYSVGKDADENSKPLREAMKEDKWPDGRPVWTPLTAVSLLVYFVLAMQCISTLAVVKRETNSWTWPAFMLVYMTGGAWVASFLVYQGGKLLGWG